MPFSYYGSLTQILSDAALDENDLEEAFVAKRPDRSRKEASATEKRSFQKQFAEAKRREYESWMEHDVFELVDLRKVRPKNFVQGRWVLTIKRKKGLCVRQVQGSLGVGSLPWVVRRTSSRQTTQQPVARA